METCSNNSMLNFNNTSNISSNGITNSTAIISLSLQQVTDCRSCKRNDVLQLRSRTQKPHKLLDKLVQSASDAHLELQAD